MILGYSVNHLTGKLHEKQDKFEKKKKMNIQSWC